MSHPKRRSLQSGSLSPFSGSLLPLKTSSSPTSLSSSPSSLPPLAFFVFSTSQPSILEREVRIRVYSRELRSDPNLPDIFFGLIFRLQSTAVPSLFPSSFPCISLPSLISFYYSVLFFSLSPSLFLFPPLVVNSGNCCHLSSFHPLERFNWYLAKCAARLLLLKVGSEKQIKEKKSGIAKRKKASSHLFEENQFTCDRAKQGKTKTTPGFYWRALPVTPNQTIHSLYSLL